jgi:hypothetical protein
MVDSNALTAGKRKAFEQRQDAMAKRYARSKDGRASTVAWAASKTKCNTLFCRVLRCHEAMST